MRVMAASTSGWLFLNPIYASVALYASVCLIIFFDVIVLFVDWNSIKCSNLFCFWIIGKYLIPLLSYFSFIFLPCYFPTAVDLVTRINSDTSHSHSHSTNPNNNNSLAGHSVSSSAAGAAASAASTTTSSHAETTPKHNNNKINCWDDFWLFNMLPYPLDLLASRWFFNPSDMVHNMGRDLNIIHNDPMGSLYVYIIGVLFDRGTLLIIWICVGGLSVIYQDDSCSRQTPLFFYYVLLQVVLGLIVSIILIAWIITSSVCPLMIARGLACCNALDCDLLGIFPNTCWKQLFTSNMIRNNNNINNNNLQQDETSNVLNDGGSNGLVQSYDSNKQSNLVTTKKHRASTIANKQSMQKSKQRKFGMYRVKMTHETQSDATQLLQTNNNLNSLQNQLNLNQNPKITVSMHNIDDEEDEDEDDDDDDDVYKCESEDSNLLNTNETNLNNSEPNNNKDPLSQTLTVSNV